MIDPFYKLHWRRLSATFSPETLERHEGALMRALDRRRQEVRAKLELDEVPPMLSAQA